MPIYEYVCDQCGKLNDVLQKVSDPPPAQCNSCGAKGRLTKIVSRSSFVLAGGGWYSDLYSSTKKDSDKSSKDSEKSPDAGDKKPAADASKKTDGSSPPASPAKSETPASPPTAPTTPKK